MTKRPMFLFTLLISAFMGLTATACETGGWSNVLEIDAPSHAGEPAEAAERKDK